MLSIWIDSIAVSIQYSVFCSALINIQPLEELNANIWSVGLTQINCWANIVGSFSRCFSSIQDWRGRLMATLSDYVRVTVFVEIWNMNFWQRFRILRGPFSIHKYGQKIFWWFDWFPFHRNAKTGKTKSNQMPKVPLFTFPNLINWLTFDFDNRLRKRQLAIQTISYQQFILQKGEVLITFSSLLWWTSWKSWKVDIKVNKWKSR